MASKIVIAERVKSAKVPGYDIGREYLNLMEKAFRRADTDRSGSLNPRELRKMWSYMFGQLHQKAIWRITDDIHGDLDNNRDGQVSWPEIEKFFTGQACERTEVDKLIEPNVVSRAPSARELLWQVWEIDAPEYEQGVPKFIPYLRKCASFLSNCAIFISIVNFVLESMPNQQTVWCQGQEEKTQYSGAAFTAEAVCIAFFTVEFIFRVSSCPSQRDFWYSFYTIVDVFAILPFYIDVAASSNSSGSFVVLRVLRLLRLLRMLKLGRAFEAVQVLIIAIARTIKPLLVAMVGVNSIAVVLFASLIFAVERDEACFNQTVQKWVRSKTSQYPDAGQEIYFQSIPASMWWCWVTLTTVGYGDMYPLTGPGKAIAAATMVGGLVLMSFPLTLLASSFSETMGELRQKKASRNRGRAFMANLMEHCHKDVLEKTLAHSGGTWFSSGPQARKSSSSARDENQVSVAVTDSKEVLKEHAASNPLARESVEDGTDDQQVGRRESFSSLQNLNPERKSTERLAADGVQMAAVAAGGALPVDKQPDAALYSNEVEFIISTQRDHEDQLQQLNQKVAEVNKTLQRLCLAVERLGQRPDPGAGSPHDPAPHPLRPGQLPSAWDSSPPEAGEQLRTPPPAAAGGAAAAAQPAQPP